MRSNRKTSRADDEVLALSVVMDLLGAVAAGEVVRGLAGGDTGFQAAHYWLGQPVRWDLRRMAQDDLILMPISGPPRLAPRGQRLLASLEKRNSAAE